jgi:hypothetical protein
LTLQFAGMVSGTCLSKSAPSGLCATGAVGSLTATNLGMGHWSSTSNSYNITAGCYAFVIANSATDAYQQLAHPSAGHVVHLNYPWSATTPLVAGACS